MNNKRLLFYYPSNKRTVSFETQIKTYLNHGYQVYFLTTCERGLLHDELEANSIKCYTNPINNRIPLIYYFRQIYFLISFVYQHKIDFVLSNLQHANIISVISQFFIPARVYIFRHHFKFNKNDVSIKVNKNEVLFDKIINRLARQIIVPSKGVYNGMKAHERVNMSKVKIIPYVYDFTGYSIPDSTVANRIKDKYPAELRLIISSRLVKFKRHDLVFKLVNKLIKENFNIHLFVLDEGPEKQNLENYIVANSLQSHITMLGYRPDFLEFIDASDVLVHPSLTEASSSMVKEVGLLKKTAIVCKGVGDFDEYIEHQKNGFLLDQENFAQELEVLIREIYCKKYNLNEMGENLRQKVFDTFSINDMTFKPYLKLLN